MVSARLVAANVQVTIVKNFHPRGATRRSTIKRNPTATCTSPPLATRIALSAVDEPLKMVAPPSVTWGCRQLVMVA